VSLSLALRLMAVLAYMLAGLGKPHVGGDCCDCFVSKRDSEDGQTARRRLSAVPLPTVSAASSMDSTHFGADDSQASPARNAMITS
jgi:hypothetical protein